MRQVLSSCSSEGTRCRGTDGLFYWCVSREDENTVLFFQLGGEVVEILKDLDVVVPARPFELSNILQKIWCPSSIPSCGCYLKLAAEDREAMVIFQLVH